MKMDQTLKVIIAEDEERIVTLIKALGEWESLNMEVAGVAENGEQAIGLIRTIKPDILISDIRMQGMNGLEVAKWTNENFPDTYVIIISGYKQFDYAYDCLKLKIIDFLLKPINKEELNKVLTKISSIHSAERATLLRDKQREEELEKSRMKQRKQFVLNLLYSADFAQTELEKINSAMFTAFRTGAYLAIELQIFNVPKDFVTFVQSSYKEAYAKNMFAEKIESIFQQSFSKNVYDIVIYSEGMKVYLLLNFNIEEKDKIYRIIEHCLNIIYAYLEVFIGVKVLLTTSGVYMDHMKLPDGLRRVQELSFCRFVCDIHRPLIYEKFVSNEKEIPIFFSNLAKKIRHGIAISSMDEIEGAIKEEFELNKQKMSDYPRMIKSVIDQHLNLLFISAEELHCCMEQAFLAIIREYLLYSAETLEQLEERLCEVFCHVFQGWFEKIQNQESLLVRTLKQYIHEHYCEEITLDILTKVTNFSGSYLSSTFSKEAGMTISEYILNSRMEQAKELLTTSFMNITEIAQNVGYQDAKYFSKLFQKQVGIRPSEYREIHKWCDL